MQNKHKIRRRKGVAKVPPLKELRKNMSPCQFHDHSKEKMTKLYL